MSARQNRYFVGAVLTTVGLLATGCSSGSTSPSGGNTNAATKGGSKTAVELIVGVNGSPFYEAMACGAKAEAKSLGVSLKVGAPSTFAPAQQLPILDASIAAHPKAIILVPTDPTGLNSAAQQVVQAGIKLITADQTLSNTSGVSTQILSDNVAGGEQAADKLAAELGGKGKVLVLTTQPGQVTSQDQRANGFIKGLKKHPGIEYVGAQYSNDEPSKTASQVTAELSRYPDLAGIFATNDQGGIGAASGLASAHAAGKVKLFAYDASISQVQSLQNGSIQGLVAQDPRTEGMDAVKYAVAAANGKSVPKKVETATKLLAPSTPTATLKKYEYKGSC